MSFLYSLIIGLVTLIVSAFSYLFIKSAIFRYIVRNPLALVSLIKNAPKSEEEKFNAMMNDPYLSSMFNNKDIQEEMKKNMKRLIEQQQNKKLSIQKKWKQIDEDIISDDSFENTPETILKTTKNAISEIAYNTAQEESTEGSTQESTEGSTQESTEGSTQESTDIQLESTDVQVESTDVQVESTDVQVESTDVQLESTEESTNVQLASTKTQDATSESPKSQSSAKQSFKQQTNSSHELPKPDFNNPMFRNIIQNPEMMLSMMPETPQKAQLELALKNPLMRKMMTNPELMKSMMETMPPPGNLNMDNSFMSRTE